MSSVQSSTNQSFQKENINKLREYQATVFTELDTLIKEAQSLEKTSPELFIRIEKIVSDFKATLKNYQDSPLIEPLVGSINPRLAALKPNTDRGRFFSPYLTLSSIRKDFRNLSEIYMDPTFFKTMSEGNMSEIIKKIDAILKRNQLDSNSMKWYCIEQLISQNEIKETFEVTLTFPEDYLTIFTRFYEKNKLSRLIEACPQIIKDDDFLKSFIVWCRTKPIQIMIEIILDSRVNLDFFISRCDLSVLEKLIFYGVNVNSQIMRIQKAIKHRKPIFRYEPFEIIHIKFKDLEKNILRIYQCQHIYQEVVTEMKSKGSLLFQQLVKEEALKDVPMDLKKIIESYVISHRTEIAERCQLKLDQQDKEAIRKAHAD